jgi:TPR repeat protein
MTEFAPTKLSDEPDLPRLKRAESLLRENQKLALFELNILAEQGSVLSLLFLGYASQEGLDIKVDLDASERWYRRAADCGSLQGYYRLGKQYLNQKRYEEAAAAFECAAAKGYVPAIHWSGVMYLWGKGVALDKQKGEQLLRHAASRGSIFAKVKLARYLIDGHAGLWNRLCGVRLWIEALVQGLSVYYKEGPKSQRLFR